MRHRLDQLDEHGAPAVLDSSNPENDRYYRRWGFREVGAVQVGADGPRILVMRRG